MTKTIYHYDPTNGEYLGEAIADESPLEPNVFLIPAHATDSVPPTVKAREIAVFDDEKWGAKADFRGVALFSTVNGDPVAISEIGVTPSDVNATEKTMPSQYHHWDGKDWILSKEGKQRQLEDAINNGIASINAAAMTIYAKVTPLMPEYQCREAQAKLFRDANYKGACGEQVTAYARASGQSNQDAADKVLQQAENLRKALDTLGQTRMQKFTLNTCASIADVTQKTQTILQEINTIAKLI